MGDGEAVEDGATVHCWDRCADCDGCDGCDGCESGDGCERCDGGYGLGFAWIDGFVGVYSQSRNTGAQRYLIILTQIEMRS